MVFLAAERAFSPLSYENTNATSLGAFGVTVLAPEFLRTKSSGGAVVGGGIGFPVGAGNDGVGAGTLPYRDEGVRAGTSL